MSKPNGCWLSISEDEIAKLEKAEGNPQADTPEQSLETACEQAIRKKEGMYQEAILEDATYQEAIGKKHADIEYLRQWQCREEAHYTRF